MTGNFYIGAASVERLMLGSTQVWQKETSSEVTLLPEMTFMTLPPAHWTETAPNIWKQRITANEDAISLKYRMDANGAMFFKYVDDGFNKTPDMMLFDTPELGGNTSVVDLWVLNGVFNWDDPHGGTQNEIAVNGTFYGLVRTSKIVRIMKSSDGVNFEEIAELAGDKSRYIYLQSWYHSFETNKLHYPQGKGLIAI